MVKHRFVCGVVYLFYYSISVTVYGTYLQPWMLILSAMHFCWLWLRLRFTSIVLTIVRLYSPVCISNFSARLHSHITMNNTVILDLYQSCFVLHLQSTARLQSSCFTGCWHWTGMESNTSLDSVSLVTFCLFFSLQLLFQFSFTMRSVFMVDVNTGFRRRCRL